jgi:hypothetical protein
MEEDVIPGFRRDVEQISALLGYHAALSGSYVPTFRNSLSVPSSRVMNSKKKTFFLDFITLEDGSDKLSRNVGTELPLNAA